MYESMVIQAIRAMGVETYYIPRSIVQRNDILNEAQESNFDESYMCEMYVQSIDGFEGEGNILSSFGLEIKNQVKLVVSRRRFQQLVGRHQEVSEGIRPNEGDLIYFPAVEGLFEIQFVEGNSPFHQLQNIPTYTLTCELFQYTDEDLDTGIEEIDSFERSSAYRTRVDLGTASTDWVLGEAVSQDLGNGTIVEGEIAEIISDTELDLIHIVDSNLSGETFQVTSGSILNIVGEQSGVSVPIIETNDFVTMDKDPKDQSNEFELIGNNFLDLNLENPFGMPNNL